MAKRREMHEAADNLDFETATLIRDEIRALEEKAGVVRKDEKAEAKKAREATVRKRLKK
ncbi:MAG: UvrB/uvrC motif, partial [Candidatus Parcubacteria bacterium]|jgi:protein-arginine kinase activator protein McsA